MGAVLGRRLFTVSFETVLVHKKGARWEGREKIPLMRSDT